MNNQNPAERIEQLRAALGMPTDVPLAEKIGISPRTLYSALRGHATRRTLQKIAVAESSVQNPAFQVIPSSVPIRTTGVLREQPETYDAAKPAITHDQFRALEERLDSAMEEILAVKKELRRMKL